MYISGQSLVIILGGFDLSVGSDFPGTLIRGDSQAQLKLVADELGFRYIRFHAIFHDVLGTVRTRSGVLSYDWSKIDQLYDQVVPRSSDVQTAVVPAYG